MTPGPQLDALIAEKVFGCSPNKRQPEHDYWYCECPGLLHSQRYDDGCATIDYIKRYSQDISDAWLVVEKMYESDEQWEVQLRMYMRSKNLKTYQCEFVRCTGGSYMGNHFNDQDNEECGYHKGCKIIKPTSFISDTMPHAICLAALKAMESK